MDRGAWWATVYGFTKSWTQLSGLTHTHTHVLLARATQETWLPSCDYGVELGIGEKSNMISEKKNKNIFKGADLSDLDLVPFCFSFIFLIPGIQM